MAATSLLEDLLSKDPHRIWSSSCAIRNSRDGTELQLLASHLAQIREATAGIQLGGALRPNSSHLNFAIKKLEYVQGSRGCLCKLYLEDDLYDPQREERDGNVCITATSELARDYADRYDCECALCGAKYHVVSREYHYPWWEWRPA